MLNEKFTDYCGQLMYTHLCKSVFIAGFIIVNGCSGGGNSDAKGAINSSVTSVSSSSIVAESSNSLVNSSIGNSSSAAMSSIAGQSSSAGASDDFTGQSIDLLLDNSSNWQVLHPEKADAIDIGMTVDGALTVLALSAEPEAFHSAWFEDSYGPLIYKNITGNFAVITKLRVLDRNEPTVTNTAAIGQGPDGSYNAGGFVLRDGSGTHTGNENWVMYNMGGQGLNGVTYAREIKKTVNSHSNLFLNQQDSIEETLLACRIGDTFYFYTWNDLNANWQQEAFFNNVDIGGSNITTGAPTGFSVVTEFSDPGFGNSMPMYFELDLPDTIQVGVMAHGWSPPYETRAEFDFIHFSAMLPSVQADCVSAFPNPELL